MRTGNGVSECAPSLIRRRVSAAASMFKTETIITTQRTKK
jgi:hypothetical protein